MDCLGSSVHTIVSPGAGGGGGGERRVEESACGTVECVAQYLTFPVEAGSAERSAVGEQS